MRHIYKIDEMILYETHIGWMRSTDISNEKRTIQQHRKSMGFIGTALRIVK